MHICNSCGVIGSDDNFDWDCLYVPEWGEVVTLCESCNLSDYRAKVGA